MRILLFSALAGICGTGLGGIVTSLIGNRSQKVSSNLLAFAAGVMISVVCFGLIPEAYDLTGTPITILGLLIGIIAIMLLNRLVERITEVRMKKQRIRHTHNGISDRACLLCQSADTRSMLRSGILMLIAIGLHNIPEGMAIAAPLLTGGIRKSKVILLTALSGAPTLIGGLLGVLLGNISDTAIALSLSAAGGAMLYVVFSELIPQSLMMAKGRMATVVSLAGIIIGLGISV